MKRSFDQVDSDARPKPEVCHLCTVAEQATVDAGWAWTSAKWFAPIGAPREAPFCSECDAHYLDDLDDGRGASTDWGSLQGNASRWEVKWHTFTILMHEKRYMEIPYVAKRVCEAIKMGPRMETAEQMIVRGLGLREDWRGKSDQALKLLITGTKRTRPWARRLCRALEDLPGPLTARQADHLWRSSENTSSISVAS